MECEFTGEVEHGLRTIDELLLGIKVSAATNF